MYGCTAIIWLWLLCHNTGKDGFAVYLLQTYNVRDAIVISLDTDNVSCLTIIARLHCVVNDLPHYIDISHVPSGIEISTLCDDVD